MPETSKKTCVGQNLGKEEMAAYCRNFCSTAGQMVNVPMQLGSEEYGFNLAEMNQICESVTNANPGSVSSLKQHILQNIFSP